jgi:putative sugar O-methyltransferase
MKIVRNILRLASYYFERYPRILLGMQQYWLRFGYEILDLRMASWVVRRPEWLRARIHDPKLKLEPAVAHSGEKYTAIAERLIRSWCSKPKERGAPQQDSMWDKLLDSHYAEFAHLLEQQDPVQLSRYLSSIFRSKAVNGFTYGDTFDNWPHRWTYLPIQIELSVVQLAEAVGILRAECHEQGEVAFWRRLMDDHELIARLEAQLGIYIEQPRHGDPRGIYFGGRFLTRETCSHLHSAYRIKLAIEQARLPDAIDVIEIGGGFGGTCYWVKQLMRNQIRRYAIVDLPEVGLVQAFFHGAVNPEGVLLPGESLPESFSGVQIVRHKTLESIGFRPHVMINQDSFPEMPYKEVERYVHWASENLSGIFISLNQETYSMSGDSLQVWVPEVFSHAKSFRRVSRLTSWDRRGYVEEVYENS